MGRFATKKRVKYNPNKKKKKKRKEETKVSNHAEVTEGRSRERKDYLPRKSIAIASRKTTLLLINELSAKLSMAELSRRETTKRK